MMRKKKKEKRKRASPFSPNLTTFQIHKINANPCAMGNPVTPMRVPTKPSLKVAHELLYSFIPCVLSFHCVPVTVPAPGMWPEQSVPDLEEKDR